jgi:acyl carrier protein
MGISEKIRVVLADILDVEASDIGAETYLIRDLNLESIDMLELAVSLNAAFSIKVSENDVFLRNLRPYLIEAEEKGQAKVPYLMEKFPFLTGDRIQEILSDLNSGPVLKVRDLVSFVAYQARRHDGMSG